MVPIQKRNQVLSGLPLVTRHSLYGPLDLLLFVFSPGLSVSLQSFSCPKEYGGCICLIIFNNPRFLPKHSEVAPLAKNRSQKNEWWSSSGLWWYHRSSLGHVIPALNTAGGFGCSVAGLTRCPPLEPPSAGRLPFQRSEDSVLAVGATSACTTVAWTGIPGIPPFESLAWVTDVR